MPNTNCTVEVPYWSGPQTVVREPDSWEWGLRVGKHWVHPMRQDYFVILIRFDLSPGCDMRSSDLYVLPSHAFLGLRRLLLDLKKPNTKRIVDVHPMRAYGKQWIFLPQISYQRTLDIPADYQIGAGALYVKKCVGPRPVSPLVSNQLVMGTKRAAPV